MIRDRTQTFVCLISTLYVRLTGALYRQTHASQTYAQCRHSIQWHLEFELGDPGSIPGSCHYQGRSDGGISVYIPPKSVYLKFFLCGCFVSLTHLYPPKSNSWLRLWPVMATIPLGSKLLQAVYSHCLPSFSAPRNRGIKRELFRRLSDYGD